MPYEFHWWEELDIKSPPELWQQNEDGSFSFDVSVNNKAFTVMACKILEDKWSAKILYNNNVKGLKSVGSGKVYDTLEEAMLAAAKLAVEQLFRKTKREAEWYVEKG